PKATANGGARGVQTARRPRRLRASSRGARRDAPRARARRRRSVRRQDGAPRRAARRWPRAAPSPARGDSRSLPEARGRPRPGEAAREAARAVHARCSRRAPLSDVEYELDGVHVPPPAVRLGADRAPARRGEPVVLGPAVVLARPPFALDPALLLEPLQRRIERTLIDVEHAARHLLNARADPPAVHRLEGERLQDEEVERAPKDVG